jgi:hypothetical protein
MIAFLFSPVGKTLGSIVLGAAIISGVYAYAYERGAQSERREALERSIDLLRERHTTDETIRNMDDVALCAALGGRMSDAGTCE